MKYLLLFTTLIFAGELEVDGDLKVTGTVDASGNPITNVGAPLLSTDAVNAGTLASVLSDDGVYEYKFVYIMFFHAVDYDQQPRYTRYAVPLEGGGSGSVPWSNGTLDYINNLSAEGWQIFHRSSSEKSGHIFSVYEFRRKVSDD